ncbi:hypothetical protein [Alteromonas macleodii]|uniref:hypothetical protein n=1 Tax=Alteromonas macleodii TaxID=28108 RepID=UPI001930B742|nr:hypothetical protein [Alteromonas macleodii]|tara:strand:- start:660 stop:1118 length:459 start_codon:yes stop_codon:yes gene_type:complete
MDEQTYLTHWIDRFSDEAKSEIAPDWSKDKSEDLNQPFRQKVIMQLCDAMTPAPSLALALLEAETSYCEEAESASRALALLGSLFFVLSDGGFVSEYKACKHASFDSYHALIPEMLSDKAIATLRSEGVLNDETGIQAALQRLNQYLKAELT